MTTSEIQGIMMLDLSEGRAQITPEMLEDGVNVTLPVNVQFNHERITIGRGKRSDVYIRDRAISREMAEIQLNRGEMKWIFDPKTTRDFHYREVGTEIWQERPSEDTGIYVKFGWGLEIRTQGGHEYLFSIDDHGKTLFIRKLL